MTLKYRLSEAEVAELAGELQARYVRGEDGAFTLDAETPAERLKETLTKERGLRQSVERRLTGVIQEGSAALTAAQAERDAAMRAAAALRGQILDARVQDAATAARVHEHAIADALREARELFRVDDDSGAVVGRDAAGKFADLPGWFDYKRQTSPHWFPATASGSGAPSNRIASSGSSPGVSRAQFDSMSPAQRSALAQQGVTVHD